MSSIESTWRQAVGSTIRAERAARGWTQDQLAERAGMSRQTIARFESGDRSPDFVQGDQIAEAFGMLMSDLIEAAEKRRDARKAPPDTSRGR